MARARVVVGANFGDEGKGLVTDYLCYRGGGVVIRFNGGAQAGHTVETPGGTRHIFRHYGSGSFFGMPTYLSRFFICNPYMAANEFDELRRFDLNPALYAHPDCLVSTFADAHINQCIEDARGEDRHGSCGLGISETIDRSNTTLKITMGDLWSGRNLKDRLYEISTKYVGFRGVKPINNIDEAIEAQLKLFDWMANASRPAGMDNFKTSDPIFEGAQGLLLDQDNKDYFPHVTRSNTGIKNVLKLCDGVFDRLDIYYVTRSYLTRHGAGPLPGEDPTLSFPDETNKPHNYQGALRFAPLDMRALRSRIENDSGGMGYKLVMTHCDQYEPRSGEEADLKSYGPTRRDIR